jgi:hypothetical protein
MFCFYEHLLSLKNVFLGRKMFLGVTETAHKISVRNKKLSNVVKCIYFVSSEVAELMSRTLFHVHRPMISV